LRVREFVHIADAFAFFVASFALHADDDATVGERLGQMADGSDAFRTPGAEMTKDG